MPWDASLPTQPPRYLFRLARWSPRFADGPEPQFIERVLSLSDEVVRRLDHPDIRRASLTFLGDFLPPLLATKLLNKRLGDRTRAKTWAELLGWQGLAADQVAQDLLPDVSFGIACAHADADLGLSLPGHIDSAVMFLWYLCPEINRSGSWDSRLRTFVGEAAYFSQRGGPDPIARIVETFATDCVGLRAMDISALNQIGRILAAQCLPYLPSSDPRIQALEQAFRIARGNKIDSP